jgi:hypothetical protein
MEIKQLSRLYVGTLPLVLVGIMAIPAAYGNSCTMQAQIPPTQRQDFSNIARTLVGKVQSGDISGLRADTLAAVAANFNGIANSATALKPQIGQAGLTVDSLIAFEATPAPQGAQETQFFCGPADSSMTVVLSFPSLPPGQYVLAIVHATGIPNPQQVSLILAKAPDNQWKLAGFYAKPMMLAGQNGLWYWSQARQYAQKGMVWPAWFYYQIAAFLVNPVDFLSSPNIEKLRQEAEKVHPSDLPGDKPWAMAVNGSSFEVTKVDTSTTLGPLDFVIRYRPTDAQAAQLRDPVAARSQVISLMAGVLSAHPGLKEAFHGVWVYADTGEATVFALELPMSQIPGGGLATASNSSLPQQ